MTSRQREALEAIHRHVLEWGWAPLAVELADALGVSKGAGIAMLKTLSRLGVIVYTGEARCLLVTTVGHEQLGLLGCPRCLEGGHV